jgi:hypothetical protein
MVRLPGPGEEHGQALSHPFGGSGFGSGGGSGRQAAAFGGTGRGTGTGTGTGGIHVPFLVTIHVTIHGAVTILWPPVIFLVKTPVKTLVTILVMIHGLLPWVIFLVIFLVKTLVTILVTIHGALSPLLRTACELAETEAIGHRLEEGL